MKALSARRRHPVAFVLLLVLGLLMTGGMYAAFAPSQASAQAPAAASDDDVKKGDQLFLANCATCHGTNATGTAAGPSLVGVGAAAVDFQVGTGRMPLAQQNTQALRTDKIKYSDEQIRQMAAYVASLGPGPAVPDDKYASGEGAQLARGGELFRVNCSMCHNFAGSGGALTRGKFAPALKNLEGKHIYEAMLTGPQSMPVFNEANMTPEDKRDIIGYLHELDKNENWGGHALGSFGPVGDGFFLWLVAIPIMLGAAIWLGRKAA